MSIRESLYQAGYLENRPQKQGHSDQILLVLDNHLCEVCNKPVGKQSRGSTICLNCIEEGH